MQLNPHLSSQRHASRVALCLVLFSLVAGSAAALVPLL
jgi:hypothetical protein